MAYGILNAVVYSSLLPLWEGFDEAFHYGYVDHLAVHHALPVLGRDSLSAHVWDSMKLAPVSHVVRQSYPDLTTFREFFDLPAAVQTERREQLNRLPAPLRTISSVTPNYEAHQAPLAYLVLAAGDSLASQLPLRVRVWCLRVFGAIASCLALSAAALYLSRGLGLRNSDQISLLFLVFSTQMFYATVCHVANDWLAVPLAAGLFGAAVQFHRTAAPKDAFILAIMLGLGLLTKAYFLAFVPAVLALAVWHMWSKPRLTLQSALPFLLAPLLSGPWYLRNVLLYGSLSGTVESVNGVGVRAAAAALPGIHWFSTIGYMARGSLWTGNNTFSTFSRITLDFMLLLICAGIVIRLCKTGVETLSPAERIVLAGIFFFTAAIVFATAQEFVFRKGAAAGASVWYTQPLLTPVMCLVLAGFARAGAYGRWLLTTMLIVWTYVICATWWIKLIPLYSGYEGQKAGMVYLVRWYAGTASAGRDMLSNTALLPAPAIYWLSGIAAAAAIALCGLQVFRGARLHLARVTQASL